MQIHTQDVAQAVPGQPGLLGISSFLVYVGPEPARIQALLVRRGEAECRELRIWGNVPALINVFPNQMSHISVAADEMMSKERMGRAPFIRHAIHGRG